MNEQSFKGFYRFSDSDLLNHCSPVGNLKEQFNIVQKVKNDGVEYEFMISFYELNNTLTARAEIFDESFCAFDTHGELFAKLSEYQSITPYEMENLLVSLGYRNLTKEDE